jgi:hypothetical protein
LYFWFYAAIECGVRKPSKNPEGGKKRAVYKGLSKCCCLAGIKDTLQFINLISSDMACPIRCLKPAALINFCILLWLCSITPSVAQSEATRVHNYYKVSDTAEEPQVQAATPSEHVPDSPSSSDPAKKADLGAMIKAAKDLGMPRLEAYLKRISELDNKNSQLEEVPAPAPFALDIRCGLRKDCWLCSKSQGA